MRKHKLARRSVLRGSGVAIALPLLEAMHRSTPTEAATQPVAPRRVAFFYIPNGVVQTAWNLAEVGKDYKLSPTLKPIESVREHMLVVSNLVRP